MHIITQPILATNLMSATVFQNCRIATMQASTQPYGLLENGAVVVESGIIKWCGASDEIPESFKESSSINLEGRLVTPALIDCHTHLVFGGNRAREFEQRLGGATYQEIAAQGGGIRSTVKATREASEQQLFESASIRLQSLIDSGVGVVEIKSGYGLTIEHELRMLRVARELERNFPVTVKTTWLAAHAVPQEFQENADAYIDEVVIPGLDQAHQEGLVDAVDGFCESIAFNTKQVERVFQAARDLGLPVKLHAEQLSDSKGALLAAQYGALSADHLEYLAVEDVPQFAQSGAVAVLLPGAFYFLKEQQLPPIEALRAQQVPIALATDCNPGSSPISSMLTILNMACTLFGMTPEEALSGVTRAAARALGMEDTHGTVEVGKAAELAIWNLEEPAELSYWLGNSPLHQRITTASNYQS